VNCRVWDCSEKLKSFKYQATDLSSADELEVSNIIDKICKNRFRGDYFTVINFKNEHWIKEMPTELKQTFINQYKSVLDEDRLKFMEKRTKLYN
jgi:hypothetical protein